MAKSKANVDEELTDDVNENTEENSETTTDEQPAKRSNSNPEKKKIDIAFTKGRNDGASKTQSAYIAKLEAKGYEIQYNDNDEFDLDATLDRQPKRKSSAKGKKSDDADDDEETDFEKQRLLRENRELREEKQREEVERELRKHLPEGIAKPGRVIAEYKRETGHDFRKLPSGEIRIYSGKEKGSHIVKDKHGEPLTVEEALQEFVDDNPEFLITEYRPNKNGDETGTSKMSTEQRIEARRKEVFGDEEKRRGRWDK